MQGGTLDLMLKSMGMNAERASEDAHEEWKRNTAAKEKIPEVIRDEAESSGIFNDTSSTNADCTPSASGKSRVNAVDHMKSLHQTMERQQSIAHARGGGANGRVERYQKTFRKLVRKDGYNDDSDHVKIATMANFLISMIDKEVTEHGVKPDIRLILREQPSRVFIFDLMI